MQNVLIFSVFPSVAVHFYVGTLAGKVWHFVWPVKVLKSGIFQIWKKFQNPVIFGILPLFQIFKIPLFMYPWRPIKVSPFFWTRIFFVYIRWAWAYYPFAETPSLESKHEHTHTHTHTHTQILTALQPPIGPLEIISWSRQTWFGILNGRPFLG